MKIRIANAKQWNVPLIVMIVSGSFLNMLALLSYFLLLVFGRKGSLLGSYLFPTTLGMILSALVFLPLFAMGLFRGAQRFLKLARTSLLELIAFCIGAGLAFSLIVNAHTFNVIGWVVCLITMCSTGICLAGALSRWKAAPTFVRLLVALMAPLIGSGLGHPFQALAASGACIAFLAAYGIYDMRPQQLSFSRHLAEKKQVQLAQ